MKKVFYIYFALVISMFSSQLNVAMAQSVSIPDANLEAAVRQALDKQSGAITKADMKRLTFLDISSKGIISLTGLKHAVNLTTLYLWNNEISDFSPLADLKSLEQLSLWDSKISDISPLADLKSLERLYLSGNEISDLSPLTDLKSLERLSLWDNEISDLSPLTDLKSLEWLSLSSNKISDLSPLTGLKSLEWLHLGGNEISNVTPLAGLTKLTHLNIVSNMIQDVQPLSGLKNLTQLWLRWNSISDVNPLAKLGNLEVLDLRNNRIRTVRSLEGLRNSDIFLTSNPVTVNVPLMLPQRQMTLDRGKFVVFSRDQDRSIAKEVSMIYQNWAAFIKVNPVITKPPVDSRGERGHSGLIARVNETFDSFRTEGFGGTLELIAHPGVKLNFGDLVISEIMWGRHGTPTDNQWVELYSPRKHITLQTGQYALLFTGGYLARDVIPETEHYAGWRVIDRVRNATTQEQVSWHLPGLSKGTLRDQPPVSMHREIHYETGDVPDGSLASSWTASRGRVNLQPPSHGSPGAEGGLKVLVAVAERPPLYWVSRSQGQLHRLVGAAVENLASTVTGATSLAIDTQNNLLYFGVKTGEQTGAIQRSNLNGSNVQTVLNLTAVPKDIALDSNGSTIYLANSRGHLQKVNTQGAARLVTIRQNLPALSAIAVSNGYLYWAETPGRLRRLNLTAESAVIQDLATDLDEPISLSVSKEKLYWTQRNAHGGGQLLHVNLDGTNIQPLKYFASGPPHGFTVNPSENKIYWTLDDGRLQQANIWGQSERDFVTGLLTPSAIAVGTTAVEAPVVSQPTQTPSEGSPEAEDGANVLVAAAERPPLYWVSRTQGQLQRLVGAAVENLAPNVNGVISFAIDTQNSLLYFGVQTGEETGTIQRSNLNGGNVQTVINLTAVPRGIALDSNGSTIYLANSRGRLQKINTQGTARLVTIRENLPQLSAITVSNGYLYWGEMPGRLRRLSLTAESAAIQDLATGVDEPISLSVSKEKLYWTQRNAQGEGRLLHVNLDGTNIQPLKYFASDPPHGFTVNTSENKIYWTLDDGRLQQANIWGQSPKDLVTGLPNPGAIAVGTAAVETPVVSQPTQTTDQTTQQTTQQPTTYSKFDINKDGKVNNTDTQLVRNAIGQSGNAIKNARTDVNGDNTVDIADLLLVIDNLDTDAAAPALDLDLKSLDIDFDRVQEQIAALLASGDRSIAAQRALLYLQHLLASARPDETVLLANYPNPFNPETWIPYHLAESTAVRINIYDAQGILIRVLTVGHQSAGYYTSRSRAAYWDGRNALGERVASGIYFYQLQTDELSPLRKMVILK